jgi:hypothetical protein
MTIRSFAMLLTLASAVITTPAQAIEVRYIFSGVISEVLLANSSAPPPYALAHFSTGTTFSGDLIYDTSAVEGPFRALNPGRNQANFPLGLLALNFRSGAYSYSLPRPASINVIDGLFGGDIDVFSAIGGGPGESVYSISVNLTGSESSVLGFSIPQVLSDNSFPSKSVSLSFLPSVAGGSSAQVSGRINQWTHATVVPEPSSAALIIAGLTILFGLRKSMANSETLQSPEIKAAKS